MPELPGVLRELRSEVEAALAEALPPRLDELAGVHEQLAPAAAELAGVILQGGKRLRPTLLIAGHGLAGGDTGAVMGPALALELVHTCALLHDDLIDAAATRRGRPTTHVAFARRHAEEAMAGSSEAFGRAVAILLGDLALVMGDELFCGADVSAENLVAGLRHFTVLRQEVMAGQYLDVAAAQEGGATRDLVVLVATIKSGRYTITRPLQIGAVLAGASGGLVGGLERYGEPLGRAFQVRDDLLGAFGDEAVTGKSTASDLREGKRTLLVIEALERLEGAEREEFEALLGSAGLDQAGVDRLRGLLRGCGAVGAVQRQVDAWVREARVAVDGLGLPEPWSGALRGLADWVAARRS